MGAIERAIFIDADALILMLKWGCWGRARKILGSNACLAEYVAKVEVKGYEDRAGTWVPFKLRHLSADSVPRMFTVGDLTDSQYQDYLRYFAELACAGPGERETFAMAWTLGYDVCSRDVAAREVFFRYRPQGCVSTHMDVMELLRRLKIIS